MDNKKFERLIDLIINEDHDQANALFHDIVVEKSREIYESMMEDDIDGLMSDVSADEEGADEFSSEEGSDDMSDIEVDDSEMGDEFGSEIGDEEFELDGAEASDDQTEELEDRVVDLEDKLDELMAEFEEMMNGSEEGADEFGSEEEFDSEEGADEFGSEEEFDSEEGADEFGSEEELAESVELIKVKGLYDGKIGGDDGAYTKSPSLTKPKITQTGAKPVSFSQGDEKGRAAPSVKAGPQYKNTPGVKSYSDETAPKATTSQATGTNTKSPVAESKRTVRKQYK